MVALAEAEAEVLGVVVVLEEVCVALLVVIDTVGVVGVGLVVPVAVAVSTTEVESVGVVVPVVGLEVPDRVETLDPVAVAVGVDEPGEIDEPPEVVAGVDTGIDEPPLGVVPLIPASLQRNSVSRSTWSCDEMGLTRKWPRNLGN